MAMQPSVRYVKIGSTMVAKPVSIRLSSAWQAVQAVPNAPTGVTAVPGDSSVTLSWTDPVFTGGIPITGYTVTRSPGNVTSSASTPSATIASLTNGTAYTFTVTATNAVGTGASSIVSGAVTPTATITGQMYLSPATGSYQVGDTITVSIYENSLATATNAIQADLTYDAAQLQYQSAAAGTAFPTVLQNSNSSGSLLLGLGSLLGSSTATQLVANVSFTALSAGTATIAVAGTAAIYAASNAANVLNSSINATYAVS